MQVVNITRCNQNTFESDVIVGNYSMDAKTKTIDYIYDYVLANYNILIDKEILDSNLHMELFSLKNFLKNNYDLSIEQDLIIQSFYANRENCIFLKQYNKSLDEYPIIYQFKKDEIKKAKNYIAFLVNDLMINILSESGNLDIYEEQKLDISSFKRNRYSYNNYEFEISSLYKKGIFLEEILTNNVSLKQLENNINKTI